MTDQFIHDRTKQLYEEHQARINAQKRARIPTSKPTFGPDWRGHAKEMIELIKPLRAMLALSKRPERNDISE